MGVCTVKRGWPWLCALGLLLQAATAGADSGESDNPLAGDPAAAVAGEALFASMNCDGCHGGGGTGFAAPSLADGRWRFGGDASTLFESIARGRPNGMPAFSGRLPEESIWRLVSYLQRLPVPPGVPTRHWP